MLDPITAIGLAGNILTFIDYSTKVISTSIDIYASTSGSTQDTQTSDMIATQMKQFAAKLQPPDQTQLSGEEKALCKLAIECEGLAKRILDLLEKVKPRNLKSKSSSLVAGLKTKFYESERRKLGKQLGNFRAQLGLSLNYLTSSKIQTRLDVLVASAKDDSSKLQHLYDQLEHLQRGIARESYSPAAAAQLRSLLGMSEHAIELVIQHRILESLAFEGMYGRYETFDDDTDYEEDAEEYEDEEDADADAEDEDEDEDDFEDISNSSTEEADEEQINYEVEDEAEDEAKTVARESLLTWMSSGAGIFHVSGKLGSGKSTLMKYLCDHASTKQLLEQWAGSRQLVFTNFFFWKPGSTMQKSLAGLVRSLLHDVLRACPELTRDIFPDYWERIKSAPWHVQPHLSISNKDIRRAFSRIISDPSLYTNHCFCFFIDGLDEYEGTHQEDPKTLVDLLTNWTKNASTTVKICVSSREYNLFMNNFSAGQRIRLHILTKSDMTNYVVDKLRHIDREEDKMILAESIVENAEGIFVWVTLVVKRIREQIENGACLKTLKSELDAYPKELDSLFDHILNSLADADLRAAYQTFSIFIELKRNRLYLSLLSYSFLDDFTQDRGFALRKDVQFQSLTSEKRALRIELARKRLNACCKGLLETRKNLDEPASEIILITHRSISEFLSSRARKSQMEPYLKELNTVDAISQLTLAELWSRDAGDIIHYSHFDRLALALVSLRKEAKLDTAPYSFLNSLALAWRRHRDQGNFDHVGTFLAVVSNPGLTLWVTTVDKTYPPGAVNREKVTPLEAQRLRHPIFAAASCGNYEYILWELDRDPSNIPLFTPLRLMYCIFTIRSALEFEAEQQLLNVIDALHTHHGLCPSTVSNLFGTLLYPATQDNPEFSSHGNEAAEVTLWHHILLFHFLNFSNRSGRSLRLLLGYNAGCIIEKILEYEADPHFYLSITSSPRFRMRLVSRVQGERREQWFAHTMLFDLKVSDCENVSLADLVESWNFKNKLRILELIKINTLKIESAIAEENITLLKELTPYTPGMEELEDLEDAKELRLESNSEEIASAIDSSSKKLGLAGIFEFWSLKLGFSAGMSVAILILGVLVAVISHRSFG